MQDRDEKVKSKQQQQLLGRGLEDRMLEDRLQMVCPYITCFYLQALPYIV